MGLCRITDAKFNADGNITGGTYVFEENADICEGARRAGGRLCGGAAWKGVYFYDWDPFNTIDWTGGGNCEVTLANGDPFGVSWGVDCGRGLVPWVCEHKTGLLQVSGGVLIVSLSIATGGLAAQAFGLGALGTGAVVGCSAGGSTALVVSDGSVGSAATGCLVGGAGGYFGAGAGAVWGTAARPLGACFGAGGAAALVTGGDLGSSSIACASAGGAQITGSLGSVPSRASATCLVRTVTTPEAWSLDVSSIAAACARGAVQGAPAPAGSG